MFKLRKVVLVILLLVGVVTDIASTQDDEVCIPIRRSRANEDGLLNEPRAPASAGPPGKRGGIGAPGLPGPAGNPGICACDPSEIQQVRTDLIAEIIRNKENLIGRMSALIDLHEPTLHEIFCTIPSAPKFGSIISSHKRVLYNQSIFYTCDEGYAMVGVSSNILVAKCQQNGTWTRETPVCVDPPCNPNPCLKGICINQFSSNSYNCYCPAGYEGRNCSTFNAESCSNTIGMEDERIKHEQLSASSSYSSVFLPKYARLDLQPVSGTQDGCWVPSRYRAGEWIQVDIMRNVEVVAIITQGYSGNTYGITGFKISYGTSVDQLQVIQDNNGNDVIFRATPNHNRKTRNDFPHPVSARYIRLIVQEWHPQPYLRMEYITC